MFCHECGKEISDNAKFCKYCGTNATDDELWPIEPQFVKPQPVIPENVTPVVIPVVQPQNEKAKKEPKPKKEKKGKLTKIVIGIAGFAVIAAVAAGTTYAAGGFDYLGVKWENSFGDRYLEELEYEQAIVSYKNSIKIDPKQEEAYIGLAKAYVGLGEYEEAIDILNKGIRKTDSKELEDLLEEIEAEWEEIRIRLLGHIYKVDTDLIADNNEVITNAFIEISDKSGNRTSYEVDENGYYETGMLEKGNYTASFYADGYLTYQEEVKLTGGAYELNAYIEPEIYTDLYGNISIADEDTNYSNNTPLPNAEIMLVKKNASNHFVASTMTDYNGQYVVENLTMGVYEMTISKDGYIVTTQDVIIYEGQNANYNVMIEVIDESYSGIGVASGTVYDALTGRGVEGLTLTIREGIANMDGPVVGRITTMENGYYLTPELDGGNYCITIEDQRLLDNEDDRYITTSMNIKILGGLEIPQQDGTVSNMLAQGQLRIVLTWGETPLDLDSHMEGELETGDTFHIYYRSKEVYMDGDLVVNLDLDDTSSYGPETTTIYKNLPGIYKFYVYNYSGGSTSALANSRACVQIYMDYSTVPSYVFYVPYENGYTWDVFEYDTRNGRLYPINEMN